MNNQTQEWSTTAKILHWLTAIIIFIQIPLGDYAHELDPSPAKIDAFVWHKSLGMLILLLAVIRLSRRMAGSTPASLAESPALKMAAKIGHWALYLLMLIVPISGWVITSAANVPLKLFWLVPLPALTAPSEALAEIASETHETLVGLLVLLIVGHIAAALWHHFKLKDITLKRMWH